MNVRTITEVLRVGIFALVVALGAVALGGCGDDDGGDDGMIGDGDGDGDGDGHGDDDGHGDGDGDGDGHGDGDMHDAGHGDAGGHGNGHTTCGLQENCTDVVELEEGLEVEGDDGLFTVTILSHNALTTIDNEWEIEVTDADGEKVENATVTVQTFSVDCMHPGPAEDAEVTANADGNYDVQPVNAHGGPWETMLDIETDEASDRVVVPLCVPGESHGGGAGHDAGASHDAGHEM